MARRFASFKGAWCFQKFLEKEFGTRLALNALKASWSQAAFCLNHRSLIMTDGELLVGLVYTHLF